MHEPNLKHLQMTARTLIWSGLIVCGLSFLLSLPSVSSVMGLLSMVAGTLERTAHIVGVGAVLLVLAQLSRALSQAR